MSRSRWLLVALGVIAGVLAGLALLHQKPTLPSGSASAERLQAGPYAVGTLTLPLVDSTRTTSANKDFEGAPYRELPTTVWYPKDSSLKHLPLIVQSHGFSSLRTSGKYFAEHLASMGFVVAAPDFPLTSYSAPGGVMVQDVINQPQDVSFLLDNLLQLNKDSSHPLFNLLDPDRIALTGISLGAMTAVMTAFDPHHRDRRVKAVIAMGGPTSMFTQRYFEHADVPLLMIATDQDALVNYADNALPIMEKLRRAMLITVSGGSHSAFADPARLLSWLDNPDSLGCYVVTHNLDMNAPTWYHLIGSEKDGVIAGPTPKLCTQSPLPPAMHPAYQQDITNVAVAAFLSYLFLPDRSRDLEFLITTLPREIPEVRVQHHLQ